MRLSVALIACMLAGGALFVGLRLSSAVEQASAIASPGPAGGGMHADRADNAVGSQAAVSTSAEGGVHTASPLAARTALVEAGSETGVPPDAADDTPAPSVDEREFLLEYFGPEVSLNDLGQLAVPDPEFERAIRERANGIGEIPAAP